MAIVSRGRKSGQHINSAFAWNDADAAAAGQVYSKLDFATAPDDFGSSLGASNLGSVTVGGTTTANIETAGDRDWFRVTLVVNQSYIIRVTSTSALDPAFVLLDSNGIAVGGNDDFAGEGANARINFTAVVGGTYYINAGSPFGSGVDSVGAYTVSVAINPSPPPPPVDDFGAQTGAPNLGSMTAGGASVTGTINFDGDRDWFAVTLTAGQAYFFTQNRNSPAASLDPHLFLRDSVGNILTNDDDGGGAPNSRIAFTATVTGTYYLDATSFQGSGTGAYTLNVAFNGSPPPPPVDDFGSQIGAANLGSLTVNGGSVTGNIEVGGDRDWFAVTLVAGGLYRFNHNRVTIEDPRFSLRNAAGTVVGGNDDFAPPNVNAQLDYVAPTSGIYYLDANSPFQDNTGTYTVSVTQLNTAPTLGTNGGLTLNEGATGTITTARLDYNDIEQADSAITYTITSGATNGTLRLSGNALAVNGTFTQADINNNLVTYVHNGSETTSATFAFSVSDGAGGSVTGQSFAISVTPVNDAPTLTATGVNPVFTENGAPVDLFSAVNASTVETGQTFTGFTLTVTNVTNAASERLTIDGATFTLQDGSGANPTTNGLNISVSLVGTTATVTATVAALAPATLQTIIDQMTYQQFGDTPIDTNLVFTITQLIDSGSNTAPNSNTATLAVSSTVNVNPVNDAPTLTGVPANFQLTRNATLPLDYSSVVITDVDGPVTVTITASPGGTLVANASAGITIGGSGMTLTLDGTAAALTTYFDTVSNINYTPPLNFSGNADGILFQVRDGIAPVVNVISQTVVVDPISLTTPGAAVTENFDALVNAGTTNQLLVRGWSLNENGTSANNNELYAAGTGSGNGGDVYSFGTTAGDRALGTLLSGTLSPTIGAAFTNNTGAVITSLTINFRAEQWRLGSNTGGRPADRLDFQISTNATALTNGTWTDDNGLDHSSIVTSGTVGALDGNALGNFITRGSDITGLSIAPGATFWIRWVDFDVTGSDDGLAIDDFSITARTNTTPVVDLDAVAAGNDAAVAYTENAAAVAIAPLAGVTDADMGDQIVSAVVTLTDPRAGDVIAVSAALPTGITAVTTATTITLSGAATPADYAIALRLLTFASTSDDPTGVSATRNITVVVNDGDANSIARTSVVTITPLNDAPSGTNATLTLVEDTPRLLTIADFGFTDPDSANALGEVLITGATGGTMFFDGDGVGGSAPIAITGFPQSYGAADFTAGRVSFVPNANLNGTGVASLSFQVRDNSGTATETDPSANTLTFNVTPVNDAPSGSDATFTLNEDGTRVLLAADFGFTDLVENNGFAGVVITTLPTDGVLLLNGVTVTVAGTFVTAAQLAANQLVFAPSANENGTGYASFTFQVRDDGGTANGGQNTDPSANTLTFNVNAVNDAPVNTLGGTIGTNEDAINAYLSGMSVSDVDANPATDAIFVTFQVTSGTLSIRANVSGGIVAADIIAQSTNTITVLATINAINATLAASNGLTYSPNANFNGNDTLTVTTNDGGATGIDPGLTGDGASEDDADTRTIVVASVNDAPSGTDTTVTGSEDDPYVFTIADFGFSDVDGNGFLGVILMTLPGNGTITLGGSGGLLPGAGITAADIAAGNLRFVPDADEFGTNYASFTFRVRDDGGTQNGGVNTDQSANTITINVTPDNVAPVLDLDPAVGGINATVTYFEGGAAALLGNALVLTDDNVGDLMAGATVVLTNARTGDALAVSGTLPPGISITTTQAMGTITITLSGAGTAADYHAVLRAIGFSSSSNNPADGAATRTIVTTVDDGLALSTAATTTINVTNSNDAPTGLVLASGGTIEERSDNGTVVARFAATDVDTGDVLAYSLSDNAGGRFAIDAMTGVLTIAGSTDFETAAFHDVTVVATDLAGARTSGVFRITITDVFDPAVIMGTPEDDKLVSGTRFGETILALAGNDTVTAGAGDDIVFGGSGDDVLRGEAGSDSLAGEDGNDVLDGGAGAANALVGGDGNDLYIVSAVGDSIVETAFQGIDEVRTGLSAIQLAEFVENLTYTGTASFAGSGNALDNIITGGVASDQLAGLDGNDVLDGRSTVAGQEDALVGGLGNDIYIAALRGTSVVEFSGQGIDEVRASSSVFVLPDHVENLTYTGGAAGFIGFGNALNNVITGGIGFDGLVGDAGNDTLRGGAGAANELIGGTGDDTYVVEVAGDTIIEFAGEGSDTVVTALANYTLRTNVENLTYIGTANFGGVGTADNNRITGGAGADALVGLEGDDVLTGGSGADLLIGGIGADRFVYSGNETGGIDRILDFTSGIDTIALSSGGFVRTATIDFVNDGPATSTNSTFLYDSNTGILSYDADGAGTGAAVQLAQLNGGLALSVADFVFV